MQNAESEKGSAPTIEELYDMKFTSIESAKTFLEEHNIPLIWPSDRDDGHIMTNANGEAVVVNGKEIPAIGKLTENDRGGVRLTGLARGKIAYEDPNLSVQDLQDRNLSTMPSEENLGKKATSSRGLLKRLFRGNDSKAA